MGGPRIKRCRNDLHRDRVMRGGAHAICIDCDDVFPCRDVDCGHHDCGWVRTGEQTLAEAANLNMLALRASDIPPGGAIGELGTMECFEDGDP